MADIAKLIVSVRNDMDRIELVQKLNSLILESQSFAIAAQQQVLELQSELTTLRTHNQNSNNWQTTSALYRRYEAPSKTIVYQLINETSVNPMHYACPNCFEKQQLSILQPFQSHRGGQTVKCVSCNVQFTLIPHRPAPPIQYDRDYDPFM